MIQRYRMPQRRGEIFFDRDGVFFVLRRSYGTEYPCILLFRGNENTAIWQSPEMSCVYQVNKEIDRIEERLNDWLEEIGLDRILMEEAL